MVLIFSVHFAYMYIVDERGLKCFHNLGPCHLNEHHQTKVNINCNVKYVGNIPPVMHWRITGHNFTANIIEIRENQEYNIAVTTIEFEPNQLLRRDNAVVRIICETANLTDSEYKNHTQQSLVEHSLGK